MMAAARRGAVHGLFFGAGFWAGLLFFSNYETIVKRIRL